MIKDSDIPALAPARRGKADGCCFLLLLMMMIVVAFGDSRSHSRVHKVHNCLFIHYSLYMHDCPLPVQCQTMNMKSKSCIQTFVWFPREWRHTAIAEERVGSCGFSGSQSSICLFQNIITPLSLDTKGHEPLNPCFITSTVASSY